MVILALVVLGLRSYTRMPIEELPPIEIPVISITTVYPGAGPEEIETLITQKIEDAVGTVSNIKSVSSTSSDGVSSVVLEFVQGANIDVAASDVRDRLDLAVPALPKDAEKPILFKVDISAFPVLTYGVSGNRPVREVQDICERVVKDRLSQVPGVAAVTVVGGAQREIRVSLDPAKLKYYRITAPMVVQALSTSNLNLPAGTVDLGGRSMSVRTVGEFPSVVQVGEVAVPVFGEGNRRVGTVRLGDLGKVEDTIAKRTALARLNGHESVSLQVQRQTGANTIRVVDDVKSALVDLRRSLPRDLQFEVANDMSTFARDSVHDVRTALFAGALLASLVVYLFLRTFRATIIIILAIPTSLLATFLPIHFAGFSQNMMVLLGMALCVGILVDDAIVVLENIFRHLSLGEQPRDAAYKGRSEIGLAAMAITLTDVVVFLPIAFMGGMVGQFFRQFGITVACATLFSLFVSFTLTPMLASRWFQRRQRAEGREDTAQGVRALIGPYRRGLDWALRHRWVTILVGYTVLALVALLFRTLPKEMLPQVDNGQFQVVMDMPPGTSLAATDSVARTVESRVRKLPEVVTVASTIGSQTGHFGGAGATEHGEVYVRLLPRLRFVDRITRVFKRGPREKMRTRGQDEIMAQVRRMMANLPDALVKVNPISEMGGGGGQRVQVEIVGRSTTEVLRASQRLQQKMKEMPELQDVDISYRAGRPEFRITVDRGKAAAMGISVLDIASTARLAVEGVDTTKYREEGQEYTIRVLYHSDKNFGIGDVENLYVATSNGQPVLLKDVARVSLAAGPTRLERSNRARAVTVSANPAGTVNMGGIQRKLAQTIQDLKFPEEISTNFAGEFERQGESFTAIGGTLLLSILLVYMLMCALFESLLYPLVIMTALPMALVGAGLALFLVHASLSIVTLIGIVMLVGLVTKNAILLVDYTNTLRGRGRTREDALREAGPVRLRPILMTSITMVMGMTPVAVGLGRGSEWRSPMAIAVIGGLIVSTLLTLFVIPCMYSVFDDLQGWLARVVFRRGAGTSGPTSAS